MHNLKSLQYLSQQEYNKVILDFCDKYESSLIYALGGNNSHSVKAHSNRNSSDMINNIKSGRKRADATFLSEATLNDFLANVIYFESEKIASWFTFSNENIYETQIDMHEPVGYGFKREITEDKHSPIKKYQTNTITLILNRSKDPMTPIGFSVETIYPEIKRASVKELPFTKEERYLLSHNISEELDR